ncbi:AraC-like DNA-binding protein [Maritalea mobilis]|uniref:AraC-like DNA-binding protein n=1 Tax=Maritalea mobilis TaxID=483324 RepID=A0A4R6VX25_9HYPH|nr:AraC family transcriptional regulator [Maritalea mobilis]TDQ67417.1 AraC-like DNA-binding protein [Maritalea mobilis]
MLDLDRQSWIKWHEGTLPWVDAYLQRFQFSRHAHDTYAIALTLAGVQSFDYRGETRHSQAGGVVVLHPDELHDGRAGTEHGFRFRTLYLAPKMVQDVLGGASLPYIENGLSTHPRLTRAVKSILNEPQSLDELAQNDLVCELIFAMQEASGDTEPQWALVNWPAVCRAQQFLDAHIFDQVSIETLAQVAQIDRWQLSRDFRAALGTSPYRYLLMRRIEQVQEKLKVGDGLAHIAASCGFADQSHLTRHFRKIIGLTPGQWQRLAR